ncbi:hypothetical protein BZB76_4496 [Actinomadura pelletieri DSM 43383]|uniref:Uncharacterized protein n=2 Tax=Actinomadura TaxID=1988 RepID=A0A372GI19_9ACTN|nr:MULTISPECIES: hypothetical protein [Actinomadura]RFS85028.1 hypothetical protein D0T12_16225 [Actinomadura spongiicola]RKS71689.1 hypothetical protein BZB76_4496 [Actinomadura pelletieri DSM 43383]
MRTRYRPHIGIVGLIYLVIGLFVAFDRDYIDADLIRRVGSALLAVFLWFLILLGVDLHIRA